MHVSSIQSVYFTKSLEIYSDLMKKKDWYTYYFYQSLLNFSVSFLPPHGISFEFILNTKIGVSIDKGSLVVCSRCFLACRSRQASIVLERYFRFEISLLCILCMLIARKEMGTSLVSGDSDIIT